MKFNEENIFTFSNKHKVAIKSMGYFSDSIAGLIEQVKNGRNLSELQAIDKENLDFPFVNSKNGLNYRYFYYMDWTYLGFNSAVAVKLGYI